MGTIQAKERERVRERERGRGRERERETGTIHKESKKQGVKKIYEEYEA